MRYYAVIDTNVLVSAMLKITSVPGQIAIKALTGEIIPLLNDEILAEYNEVLHRPKFKLTQDQITGLLEGIISRGIFIDAGPVDEILPDPKDAVFYEVVMEARTKTDARLITGNLKHFPVKSYIVTPREMLDIIDGGVTR